MYKLTRSTARTQLEWDEVYYRKTKQHVWDTMGMRQSKLYYHPERGLAVIRDDIVGRMVVIYAVSGDAKFWHDMAEAFAQYKEYKCLMTICLRDIEPYIRFWHWQIICRYCNENHYRYICRDTQGRKVVITYCGKNIYTDKPMYFVTQYLKEMVRDYVQDNITTSRWQ
jgi:hypothetical protein